MSKTFINPKIPTPKPFRTNTLAAASHIASKSAAPTPDPDVPPAYSIDDLDNAIFIAAKNNKHSKLDRPWLDLFLLVAKEKLQEMISE